MRTPLPPEEIERIARKRAGAKLGWFIHASVFTLINLFWFVMSDRGFGGRAWSPTPMLSWGLGLMLHGVSVWFLGAGGEWRERMVQRERERLQRQQPPGSNGP